MKQLRRTMLFVPGNNPGMVKDAGIYSADCIMFDLEDSVSVDEKDAARFLVYEALCHLDYYGRELLVRVNDPGTQTGADDIEAIVSTGVAGIRLPKTEAADDVLYCEEQISAAEKKYGVAHGTTKMVAAVESALGVLNARSIAMASPRLIAIALGAEDYVTNLRTTRSAEGIELLFARSMILLAARAAGIDAIDTVYSDVNNEEGFRREVELIHQLGFDGKSIINPRQIKTIDAVYTPGAADIEKALAVIAASEEARQRGSGVVSLNGRMVDKPIIERAVRTLNLARAAGVWKEEV